MHPILIFLAVLITSNISANIVRTGPYPGMTDTEEILQELQQTSTLFKAVDCDLSEQIVQTNNIGITPFLTTVPPFRITVPGQYCVTTEINVPAGMNGIIIDSDNVIIDLKSRTITGQPGSGIGILITGATRRNITITDGAIFGMGGNGLQMNSGGEQIIFENLRINRCNIGISAGSLRNFVILDCLLVFNRNHGILLNQFGALNQNGLLQNILSSFNQQSGIQSSGSSNVRFNTIDVSNNNGSGINELNGNRMSFESIQANNNSQHGIFSNGLGNSFMQCITDSNGGVGTWLTGSRLNIEDSQSKGNTLDGFRITGNNCNNTNNTSSNNSQIGFNISGNGHSYQQCISSNNMLGFQITNMNHCILNNLAKQNTNGGFSILAAATTCEIRSNTAIGNGGFGFQDASTAANNRIYSNYATNNGSPLVLEVLNFIGIPNVFISPTPFAPINFTTNISN